MMPLYLAETGEERIIMKVGGSPEVRKHLETMGFVSGCPVSVVNTFDGNIIVNIKDTRVAVSRGMAQKIMLSDDG